MYKTFFNLSKLPFESTPNPEFIFPGAQYRYSLAALYHGILQGKGVFVVTGEGGSGKTLLFKGLKRDLEAAGDLILELPEPRFDTEQLLLAIAERLGLKQRTDVGIIDFVDEIKDRLVVLSEEGRRFVLMVDEAQLLPDDTLEGIRLISNIATLEKRLVQIAVFAQTEFWDRLERVATGPLQRWVALHLELKRFSEAETAAYIRYRLSEAGANKDVFPPASLAIIYNASKGIPRVVNIICDKAMSIGFARKSLIIGPDIVREVVDARHQESDSVLPAREAVSPSVERAAEQTDETKVVRQAEAAVLPPRMAVPSVSGPRGQQKIKQSTALPVRGRRPLRNAALFLVLVGFGMGSYLLLGDGAQKLEKSSVVLPSDKPGGGEARKIVSTVANSTEYDPSLHEGARDDESRSTERLQSGAGGGAVSESRLSSILGGDVPDSGAKQATIFDSIIHYAPISSADVEIAPAPAPQAESSQARALTATTVPDDETGGVPDHIDPQSAETVVAIIASESPGRSLAEDAEGVEGPLPDLHGATASAQNETVSLSGGGEDGEVVASSVADGEEQSLTGHGGGGEVVASSVADGEEQLLTGQGGGGEAVASSVTDGEEQLLAGQGGDGEVVDISVTEGDGQLPAEQGRHADGNEVVEGLLPFPYGAIADVQDEWVELPENATISELARMRYGSWNESVEDILLQANPALGNLDSIRAGTRFRFPAITRDRLIVQSDNGGYFFYFRSTTGPLTARRNKKQLLDMGLKAVIVSNIPSRPRLHRIYAGPFGSQAEASLAAHSVEFTFAPAALD